MRIALAQLNPTAGALSGNSRRIKETYLKASKEKADLVVFGQMALSGYPPSDLFLYSNFIRKTNDIIKQELAPLTADHGPALVLGAPFKEEGNLYNSAFVLEKGMIKSVHHKRVLLSGSPFDERRYFTKGKTLPLSFIKDIPVALILGEDLLEENLIKPLMQKEEPLFINLGASPYSFGQHRLREELFSSWSARHQAPLLFLNQTGGSDELIFDGTSLIYNNRGELLYRARSFEEELFFTQSAALSKKAPKSPLPLTEDIDTIYRALKTGLKDYVHKTGFKKVILGISGGLDSALVAALAAHALGPENVLGITMPSAYSPGHSVKDALALAENLNITCRTVPINTLFDAYINLLNEGQGAIYDLAEENLQARIRGNLIMHFANREGLLALTASNKSELAVGYCTLYGDMAGGLAVIADLTKSTVYELAHHINNISSREQIPLNTINKPPSAELSPGQKDEDTLPPYHILDPILMAYLDENLPAAEIIKKGFDAETVKSIIYKTERAEFKRRQAALRLRVTTNAFGLGRRMPIARSYEEY